MYNTATGIAHAETDLKDHLGSTRVVYSVENGLLRLKQVNSYYPFSLNIKELTLNDGREMQGYNKNEYTYNGKMQQDEMNLGRLDYGARMYDAVLGRWHSVDPMAEKYRRWSPYNYCVDNPMRFVDPDGMRVGDPPYLYVFNSEQNAITGETLGEFANNNIVQDV